ncbi:MAG: DUF1573 domain-containing protein [Myxococcales bacterium]|nr:MAG: DUF1573 domain-containing protein [Myxococcales bacterium]
MSHKTLLTAVIGAACLGALAACSGPAEPSSGPTPAEAAPSAVAAGEPATAEEPGGNGKLEIAQKEFDVGDVPRGEKATHTFLLKNVGAGVLHIKKAQGS